MVRTVTSTPLANGRGLILLLAGVAAGGCDRAVDIDVRLVNPCNQDAVSAVDFIKLEPRGTGIDSPGLTTEVATTEGAAAGIRVPLVRDFQLVATGHKRTFDAPAAAIGVSEKYDLTNASGTVSISVPFALVDTFYKTTSLTAPSACSRLSRARYGASATYLPASGKVLIVGGAVLADAQLEYARQIELYDPATGAFSVADVELPVGAGRAFHSATLLADGRVLIAGGESLSMSARQTLRSALIVDARDPDHISLSTGIAMRDARQGHTAVSLASGKVLIAAGEAITPGQPTSYLASLELYDPALGAFSVPVDAHGTPVRLGAARFAHSGTLLASGADLLVAGGMNASGPVTSLEIVHVEPATSAVGVSTATASIGVGPIAHAAALAAKGTVLLAGGYATVGDAFPAAGVATRALAGVEMWKVDARGALVRVCSGALTMGRGFHSVSMAGRRAIFVGGRGPSGMMLASGEVAEILGAGSSCFGDTPEVDAMTDARTEHAVVPLPSGELLVLGGRQRDGTEPFGHSIDSAEVYAPAREP